MIAVTRLGCELQVGDIVDLRGREKRIVLFDHAFGDRLMVFADGSAELVDPGFDYRLGGVAGVEDDRDADQRLHCVREVAR